VIYLDSAATTLQKPESVSRAMVHAMLTMASPGRGGHGAAAAAAEKVFACREEAAQLFGIPNPEQVVFTHNATHALNIAIKSAVHPGDTVLISGYEHNAVTRPLYAMRDVTVKVAGAPLFDTEQLLWQFDRQMTAEVDVVICTHVSNVFGFILPIQQIAALCVQRNKKLIVDASQSAGCLQVKAGEWNASFVAMPGHKGLYGPQGTGILLCNAPVTPIIEGGTGSESVKQSMPDALPDRLEAGTHNVPGIAGLLEGLKFVRQQGLRHIQEREKNLLDCALNGLSDIPSVRLYAPPKQEQRQSNVLSFQCRDLDCEDIAAALDEYGIAVRPGLHCAPLAHESAGTKQDGTVRISFSVFNTEQEVMRFLNVMKKIAR